MSRQRGDDRPRLLMFSHCVPDATGGSGRARAWQLLNAVAATHRVCLISLFDGPVSLTQWRRLHGLVEALVIDAAPQWARLLARPWRQLERHGATACGRFPMHSVMAHRLFAQSLTQWQRSRGFDAVLATHTGLWHAARSVHAELSICDLHNRQSRVHRRLVETEAAGIAGAARRAWHQRQARRHDHIERYITRDCRLVLLGNGVEAQRYATEPCVKLVVPEAVDLAFFEVDTGTTAAAHAEQDLRAPRLVLHTDWPHEMRRARRWFMRNVWPGVKRAVPAARLSCSGPASAPATVAELQTATVVVSPLHASNRTLWPVLQAMAVARPVIAPHRALRALDARHGEHLLTPRRESDWVEHCVASLRDADVRLQLARGARTFVEDRCRLDGAESGLAAALRPVPSLARAA